MPPAQHPRHLRRVDTGADLPIPDEVAVAFPGALPKTTPDTIATRRHLARNAPLPPKAKTDITAAVIWIGSWYRGGRSKNEPPTVLYARVGDTWHEAIARSEPPEQIEIHLLAEAVLAMRARYPGPGEAKAKIEELIRDHIAPKTSPPNPQTTLPQIPKTSPPKPSPKTPAPPPPTPTSVAAEIVRLRPTPAPAAPNPPPKISPIPQNKTTSRDTPPYTPPKTAPRDCFPLSILIDRIPDDLARVIDDTHLPQCDTYGTIDGDSLTLHLPPAALTDNPRDRISSTVEIRRAKTPSRTAPAPWICTLRVGGDEATSVLQRDPRAAIDNALLRSAKTPLAPYRAALSAFLGGP